MLRKWTTLALMTAVALTSAGLSLAAQDEESPTAKSMEMINKKNLALKKLVRTKLAFSKAKAADFNTETDVILAEAKKVRAHKEPAEKQKKTYAEWTKLMDDFIKKTEDFKGVAAKTGATFDVASKSYKTMQASCSNCHNVFRVEDVD
jgi:cytochrome c556